MKKIADVVDEIDGGTLDVSERGVCARAMKVDRRLTGEMLQAILDDDDSWLSYEARLYNMHDRITGLIKQLEEENSSH